MGTGAFEQCTGSDREAAELLLLCYYMYSIPPSIPFFLIKMAGISCTCITRTHAQASRRLSILSYPIPHIRIVVTRDIGWRVPHTYNMKVFPARCTSTGRYIQLKSERPEPRLHPCMYESDLGGLWEPSETATSTETEKKGKRFGLYKKSHGAVGSG